MKSLPKDVCQLTSDNAVEDGVLEGEVQLRLNNGQMVLPRHREDEASDG